MSGERNHHVNQRVYFWRKGYEAASHGVILAFSADLENVLIHDVEEGTLHKLPYNEIEFEATHEWEGGQNTWLNRYQAPK